MIVKIRTATVAKSRATQNHVMFGRFELDSAKYTFT